MYDVGGERCGRGKLGKDHVGAELEVAAVLCLETSHEVGNEGLDDRVVDTMEGSDVCNKRGAVEGGPGARVAMELDLLLHLEIKIKQEMFGHFARRHVRH